MAVVAVSGGGQGIGRAIAWHFAALGYAVSITDLDAEAGAESLAHMQAMGARAIFLKGDVAHPAHVARWLGRTKAELGVPDLMVNNAGRHLIRKDVLKLSIAEFDLLIASHLRSTFLCSQEVARLMAARGPRNAKGGGAIVNIASTRALMSEPNTEGYSAAKGGILALTHAMALSLAPHRIRVNAISPGWIEVSDWQKKRAATKPKHSKEDREQHPVGRVGRPEDIAAACHFLCEQAPFITGQNLVIDGGMTVKMIYAE
jgi:NAD(P)-dependent dehydrogenase (short-subunit alcohol dehydrogenase family)